MSLPEREADPQVERPGIRQADAASVEAFLRANPDWLAEHVELYHVLAPPARVHGEGLADHMAAMLRVQRERADDVLSAGRAAAGLAARVQDAVLALLRSSDPADCVSGEMPALLAVDAAHLCVEADQRGARPLPPGTVGHLLDGRQVVFRDAPTRRAPVACGSRGTGALRCVGPRAGRGTAGPGCPACPHSLRAGPGAGHGPARLPWPRGGRRTRSLIE